MKSKINSMILMFSIITCFQTFGYAEQILPEKRLSATEANQAAIEAVSKLQIEKGWQKTDLGEGIEMFEISDDKFFVNEQILDLSTLYEPMNMWAYSIKSDETIELLLRVGRKGERLRVAFDPDPKRAKDIRAIVNAWARIDGYDYRIISASVLDIRIIEVSQNGKVVGLIRSYEDEEVEFNPSILRDPKEVAVEVQDSVKRFIESRGGR